MSDSRIVPVILSGGSGTRLWPVSREKHPKQLQPLLGSESLLQNTLRRLEGLPLGAPIVVSNQEYRFITAEQLRQLGLASWTLLLEPAGRNTAPALTVAALYATRDGADPVLLATPAWEARHVWWLDEAPDRRSVAQRIMQQAATGEPLFVFSRSGNLALMEQANTLKQVMGY
jgi:mannose-1-phosphate guanylyltransferase